MKPTAQIPAIQGFFGSRLVTYATQLPAQGIETILGHDPRSRAWKHLPHDLESLYTYLQRKTSKDRLDGLKKYIEDRFGPHAFAIGAFPAVSIGVQNPIEVTSLNAPGAVLMHFDLSARNHRVVVDGLGRISAALELVDVSQDPEFDEELRNELQKILKGFCIPVTFYAPKPGDKPLNQDEMAQLFHDFNFKVVPVPARVAIALDTSDIYIRLTDRVAQSDAITKHGGMEKRAASLGKKSTALVVQQTLYRFVRGATEGERFQESNREFTGDTPVLTAKSFEDELDKLSRFLNALASNMGERWTDRTSLHLSSPGWQALGVIYHDLVHVLRGAGL